MTPRHSGSGQHRVPAHENGSADEIRYAEEIRYADEIHYADEHGYTLPELLVVIAVILILATIVAPRLEHTQKRANETSAISSLRILGQREGEYSAMFPTEGYACSLTALGGKPGAGAPTPASAQLIPDDLASGKKGGYRITISNCNPTTIHDRTTNNSFHITAVPTQPGRTGDRGFCLDNQHPLSFDPHGGTNCTDDLH